MGKRTGEFKGRIPPGLIEGECVSHRFLQSPRACSGPFFFFSLLLNQTTTINQIAFPRAQQTSSSRRIAAGPDESITTQSEGPRGGSLFFFSAENRFRGKGVKASERPLAVRR